MPPTPTPKPRAGRQGKANQRRGRATSTTSSRPVKTTTRAPFGRRLRYRFDNAMSRGPMVVVAYLALLSLAVMLVTALIAVIGQLTFAGGNSRTFPEAFWQAMLRTLDSGSFAADTAWPERILALVVTIAGIFIAGSLIGLIANAVDQQVEELRKGRSPVVESGHTLILGWSDQVPRIISELVIANESEKDASVVVLARTDKTEMEDVVRERLTDLKSTRVVCRSGNPASPDDLERVAVGLARSIIVVHDASGDGDAGVVKAVLAVKALDDNLEQSHIVAEMVGHDNARTLRAVGNGRILTVSSDDVVAEVTAQACLHAGLAAVFTDLLDFDGDEIYFAEVAELVGSTYADALVGFEQSSVIGLLTQNGVELNPDSATAIAAGDRIILVAGDDSAIAFTGGGHTAPPEVTVQRGVAAPKRLAMVGWSSFGAKVLKELDEFLPDGSTIEILVDRDLVDAASLPNETLGHATVRVHQGDGGPSDLALLREGATPDRVIVLGYRDALSVDDADARTLLTLLSLRALWPQTADVQIVAELLDQANLALATPTGIDDLIVSDALASLLLAQLSERAELLAVFDDLFDADGAFVDIRDAIALVPAGTHTFGAVVAAASRANASAFGYRLGATGEVTLNPPKSASVTLGPDDQLVLLANA